MDLSFKNIQILEKLELNTNIKSSKSLEINEIFNGERRRLLKIKLTNGETLKKHRADEPITILCLAGKGVFKAGENLEEELELESGTLLTLEPRILHEVIAKPELSLLLTKFK